MKPAHFLGHLRRAEIVAAIRQAEQVTSGEIRVFVSRHAVADPIGAAESRFLALGMHRTSARNGVLIFVAPRDRKFAIIGDVAVHARCGDAFWRKVAAEMTDHFKREQFTAGILHAINKAGELLAEHFPRGRKDRNELPNQVATD